MLSRYRPRVRRARFACMAYRSKRIKAAPGTVIVSPTATMSGRNRLRNAALDVATLPVVLAGPRVSPDIVDGPVPLHYGFRRWAWRSERALEIALAQRAVADFANDEILEVGNVLAFAGRTGHTVVDKYELGAGVLNVDILDYAPGRRFGLVVSISTLEHIGWDEEPQEPAKAAAALQIMADLGDALLVTMPVGYHRELERAFIDGPFSSVALAVRTSRRCHWVKRPLSEVPGIQYGHPYPFGNGILVGTRARPEIAT